MQTLHSNDIYLDEPDAPMKEMKKMIDKKIDIVYRPREEKDENFRMKREKKLKEKEEKALLSGNQENNVETQDLVASNEAEEDKAE